MTSASVSNGQALSSDVQIESVSSPVPDKATQPHATEPGSGGNDSDRDAPAPKASILQCGVCEAAPFKYKCSRCYVPYCSVACNKAHQANHPPDPEPEPKLDAVLEATNERSSASTGPPHPFEALERSDKLVWLFRKYPNLPQQLLDIHSATLPPQEDPSKRIPASLMKGAPNRSNWTQAKGIEKGKAALRRARKLPGDAGEAIREYCTLILLLLGDVDSQEGANVTLQKQFAQRDTDMIRQLMEEERGRP